jgi:hypothetical protein
MVEQFLADLWKRLADIEGPSINPSYNEWRRGYDHGAEAA